MGYPQNLPSMIATKNSPFFRKFFIGIGNSRAFLSGKKMRDSGPATHRLLPKKGSLRNSAGFCRRMCQRLPITMQTIRMTIPAKAARMVGSGKEDDASGAGATVVVETAAAGAAAVGMAVTAGAAFDCLTETAKSENHGFTDPDHPN